MIGGKIFRGRSEYGGAGVRRKGADSNDNYKGYWIGESRDSIGGGCIFRGRSEYEGAGVRKKAGEVVSNYIGVEVGEYWD